MLPKNLDYSNKMAAATARAYTSNISPQNGSGPYYMNGSTIIVNIPTGKNLVLNGAESYLKYNLVYTAGAADTAYLRLDGAGAQSVIQRIRVFHNGNMLEDIDNYNCLMAKLIPLQCATNAQCQKMSVTSGMSHQSFVDSTTKISYYASTGERLNTAAAGPAVFAAITAAAVVTTDYYCVSLLSAICGTLSSQYTPLFAMTGSSIRVEITLVSDPLKSVSTETALSTTAANNYVNNVEFIASFIELSDQAMATIEASLGGQALTYVIPRWYNYVDSKALANATTSIACNVPAKFSSLKSLLCAMRNKSDGAIEYFSLGSTHFNLSEYRVRVGGELWPSKAPSCKAEFMNELLKAIATVSDITHTPTINDFSYSVYAIQDANSKNNETAALIGSRTLTYNFMLGMDFEVYANADKDKLFSGLNTQNLDIQWNFTFAANASAPTVRFDFFALHDAVLKCEMGNCTVLY